MKAKPENEIDPEKSAKVSRSLRSFIGIQREMRSPFPDVSPLEVATIAATLFPAIKDDSQGYQFACKKAAQLIRFSALEIENQKVADERNAQIEKKNSFARDWPICVGERLEAITEGKKRAVSRPGEEGGIFSHWPFPITKSELVLLLIDAGLQKSTAYNRIDAVNRLYNREVETDFGEDAVKLQMQRTFKGGIHSPVFSFFVEQIPELHEWLLNLKKPEISS